LGEKRTKDGYNEISSYFPSPEQYERSQESAPREVYLQNHWRPLIIEALGKYCVDEVVLDFGCGTGIYTLEAREFTDFILGLDLNQQYLDFIRRKDRGVGLVRADAYNVPLRSGVIGVVVSSFVLEYVDRGIVMSELYEILRPGGVCIVAVANKNSSIRLINRMAHKILNRKRGEVLKNEPSKREMLDLFEKNRFKVVSYASNDGLIYLPDFVDNLCGAAVYSFVEGVARLFGENPFSEIMLFVCMKQDV
jgi:SAM-dependent methyltransferase